MYPTTPLRFCITFEGLGFASPATAVGSSGDGRAHAGAPRPGVPRWVVADRGCASHAFRDHVWGMGARPAIPPKRNEAAVACPDWAYNNRNRVERLWGRLKEWRAVATRYEKTATSFMGVLCLAATLDWISR